MRSVIYNTAGANDYFAIPNDCNVIFVTGCGGGGGGGGANGSAGACGGSSAPTFWRVPLSVTPGKVIGVRVATAGAGGASGAAGVQIATEGYLRVSSLSGAALISPLLSGQLFKFFSMGFGGQGAQSSGGGSVPANLYASQSTPHNYLMGVNVNKFDWTYGNVYVPFFLMGPFVNGDAGLAAPSNPSGYGSAGRATFMGGGVGDEYASDATYASGGAGGGSIFGKGGSGGVYSGGVGNGGNATGYGAGGGGGSGGPGPYGAGGNGSPGIVIIEY